MYEKCLLEAAYNRCLPISEWVRNSITFV